MSISLFDFRTKTSEYLVDFGKDKSEDTVNKSISKRLEGFHAYLRTRAKASNK